MAAVSSNRYCKKLAVGGYLEEMVSLPLELPNLLKKARRDVLVGAAAIRTEWQ